MTSENNDWAGVFLNLAKYFNQHGFPFKISGVSLPKRGPIGRVFGRYKFDQRNLRARQVKSKVLTTISLIRRLPPPTKKVTLLLMVTRNPGVHLLRLVGYFHPSPRFQHHPTIWLALGFLNQPANRTKKNGNSKKRRRKVFTPGKKLPPTSMMRWNSFNSFSFSCSLIIKSSGTTWGFPANQKPVFSITSNKSAPLPKKQQDNNRGGGYFTWNWFLSCSPILQIAFGIYTHIFEILQQILRLNVNTFARFLRASQHWTVLGNSTKTFIYMGVSENRGTPKWMVYNGKPY